MLECGIYSQSVRFCLSLVERKLFMFDKYNCLHLTTSTGWYKFKLLFYKILDSCVFGVSLPCSLFSKTIDFHISMTPAHGKEGITCYPWPSGLPFFCFFLTFCLSILPIFVWPASLSGNILLIILKHVYSSLITLTIYILYRPLGALNYLHIWHDNSGKGTMASWYLRSVVIRDVQTDEKFIFISNRWFAVEEDDGQVFKLLCIKKSNHIF